MPNPRPLSSLRFGSYDQPPATSFDLDAPERQSSRPGPPRQPGAPSPRRSSQRLLFDELLSDMTDDSPEPRQQTASGRRRRRPSGDQGEEDAADLTARAGTLDFSAIELESMARNLKRRRLQGPVPPAPIRYGRFGQVEPGRLKLNLVSCDGGEHMDPRYPGTFLGPQNVLRHDRSVYCSERPHACLVLHHADDTPFCLEKLYIVGPENGFTAPVREGLVYVSMTFDHLRPHLDPPPLRPAESTLPPHLRHHRHRSAADDRLSFTEALRDPEIDAALGRQNADNTRDRTRSTSPESRARRHLRRGPRHPNCDSPLSTDTPDIVTSVDSTGRLFTVVSDAEPGLEDSSPQEVLDFRAQRIRAMHRRADLRSFERRTDTARLLRAPPGTGLAQLFSEHIGVGADVDALWTPRSEGGDSDSADAASDGEISAAPAAPAAAHRSRSREEDLADADVAAARFRICHGKYKVAIHFDPPVSGRYILLKLWAHQSNVDVQSVVATGYGGCRYFPAIEMR